MTWGPRPLPNVTPETAAYWEGAADGHLLIRECQDCGLVYHYPRTLCPECFSEDVMWLESEGLGEVYSYSVAHTMSGWPEGVLPLVVAYVELDEGPRLMTNVDAEPDAVDVGTRVSVRFEKTENSDMKIPVFVPVDGA